MQKLAQARLPVKPAKSAGEDMIYTFAQFHIFPFSRLHIGRDLVLIGVVVTVVQPERRCGDDRLKVQQSAMPAAYTSRLATHSDQLT